MAASPDIIRRSTSPDGQLTFLIEQTGDTLAIGFDCCGWHLHPDLIRDVYYPGEDLDEAAALERFWQDVIEDRLVIEIERESGRITYAQVCDEHSLDIAAAGAELRYWSGKPFVAT